MKRLKKKNHHVKVSLDTLSKLLLDPIQPILIDFKQDQTPQHQIERQQQQTQKQKQKQQTCLAITPCASDKSEQFLDLTYSVVISTFLSYDWHLQPALEFDNWSPIYFDQPLYID